MVGSWHDRGRRWLEDAVGPMVVLAQGRLLGSENDGIVSFKGIPYAGAPFGANRFAAPAAAPSWDGVRDAVEYGSTALKPPYPSPIDRLLADRHRRRGVPEPERVDPDAVAVLVGSGRSRRRRTAPCDQQGP